MTPRHCDVDAVQERDRWLCPICRAWKWVRPRDEQGRWRAPTLTSRVLAALEGSPGTPRELADELGHPEAKMLRMCCWLKLEGYIKVIGKVKQGPQGGMPTPIYAALEYGVKR